MSETYADRVSRVRLMASGNPKWDLSDKDVAALASVLEHHDAWQVEVAELRKDNARLDWLEANEVHLACRREKCGDGWAIWRTIVHRLTGKALTHPQGTARAAIDAAMEGK